MSKNLIALVVTGPQNRTIISGPHEDSPAIREHYGKLVAQKAPGKLYHIVQVTDRKRGVHKGENLMYWHVGEGFTHAEGWFCHYES